MSLNHSATPSGNFDLSNLRMTRPLASSGKTSGPALEGSRLSGYQNSKHFRAGFAGVMVIDTPVDGATICDSRMPVPNCTG